MGSRKVNLFLIAFKNLSRHKVKTAITMLSVVVGVTLYIFLDVWLMGINIDSQRNIVNYETGAVKIYSRAFFEKKEELPMYETFTDYQWIIDKLEENGWDCAERVKFGGSLISREQEIPFAFIGVKEDREKTVLHYHNFIEKGSFPRAGEFEILLGKKGAENLSVTVGDRVRLSTVIDKKDETGQVRHINQVMDLTVCGIVYSPNPMTNGTIGYLPLGILQDEMGLLLEGGVTEIILRKKGANPAELPREAESKVVVQTLFQKELPSELMVTDWVDDSPDYFATSRADNVAIRLMIGFLFVLATMGIANTMLMAVMERTKEIGMLRSLGVTDREVIKIFLYEAGLIGLIGSLAGIVLGIFINIYMVNVGIDFAKMLDAFGGNYGYRVVGHFKSSWNYLTIVLSGGVATFISAGTAYFPARKGVRMSIAESLRFE